ncbi:ankyrin repeat-containing domain protein, partial [Jimgerdemannia flammicorona]
MNMAQYVTNNGDGNIVNGEGPNIHGDANGANFGIINNIIRKDGKEDNERDELRERLKKDPRGLRTQRYSRRMGVDPMRKDIRVRRANGLIPADELIHRSVMVPDPEVIKLLLNYYEADVDTKLQDGWTPLHRAARYGSWEEMCMLAVAYPYEKDNYLNATTNDGHRWTLLHIAALYGQAKVVRLLAGNITAEVQLKELSKVPAEVIQLTMSSIDESTNGLSTRDPIMPGTMRAESDKPNQESSTSNPEVLPPPRRVQWTGVNPNVRASGEWTPMHCAALNGDEETVDALRSIPLPPESESEYREADIEARTSDGWTPLHFAALSGNKNMVEKLIELRANPNAKAWMPFGATPLSVAKLALKSVSDKDKKKGLDDVIEVLESKGSDISLLERYLGAFAGMSRKMLEAVAEK